MIVDKPYTTYFVKQSGNIDVTTTTSDSVCILYHNQSLLQQCTFLFYITTFTIANTIISESHHSYAPRNKQTNKQNKQLCPDYALIRLYYNFGFEFNNNNRGRGVREVQAKRLISKSE